MKVMSTMALVLALSSQAMASELSTIEGKVVFQKGQYVLQTSKSSQELSGLSLQALRQYEGRTVKVAGEVSEGSLEIYKVFVKTENGYETSYDWDVVNQELYMD